MKKLGIAFSFAIFMLATVFTGVAFADCPANKIDVTGNGTQCEVSKFEVTTTNLAAGGSLKFDLSAKGTFYVDCGDGGTLSGTGASGKTISKSTNISVTYTCTWASAGAHTIRFGGVATQYASVGLDISSSKAAISFDTLLSNNASKIASVSGSLPELFPQLGTDANQIPQFINTFKGATSMTSIPSTLFDGYTGGDNADFMFYGTFSGCTGLTAMPEKLFGTITTPADSMFSQTFEGCTSMSGYIPPSTFVGLISSGSPSATTLWYDTFEDTALATTCPSSIPQYITGYEGNSNNTTWNGVVSCGCAPAARLEGGACHCDTFTLTTTPLTANYEMSFMMSAAGIFGVDWGDGTPIETINRTNNTDSATTYSHTYTSAGTYTIGLCGTPTAYHIPGTADKPPVTDSTISFSTTSKNKIASIGGRLGALFPTLNNGATDTDFPRFYKTFQECTAITSIPEDLFVGVTGFAKDMFRETFDRCSGITTIPSNLFSGAYGGAKFMFRSVFNLCTSLTEMPEDLFKNITHAYEGQFKYAFYGDKAMSGYIPPSTFGGLIANGSPTATNMWDEAFTGGTTLATSCDGFTGMSEFTTGYKSLWNNKVSCQPMTCPSGKMLINGICDDPVFTVTTTSNTTELKISMSAQGTFYIDCGDGGTLSGSGVSGTQIARGNVSTVVYSCTWETGGPHTIKFGGHAIAYGTDPAITFWRSGNGTQANVASVTGSLSSLFPQLGTDSGQLPVFMNVFKGCTNLTSIPAGIFTGITDGVQNMFSSAFEGCTGLTAIPNGLFSGLQTGAPDMFTNTFNGCTSLTTIPSNMFGNISNGESSLFYGAFKNCSNITSIPADLFSKITNAATFMFSETFNGCTNLSGYIPPTTFAGLIANNSPTATDMWFNTFTDTNVATSCASFTDMRQYTTHYETAWNGKVSCEETPNKCKGATYYDENNPDADSNGCVECPSGYTYNTDNAKESVNQCEIHCNFGTYVATAGGTCVAVDSGYYAHEATFAYGETGNQQALQACTGATYRDANNECVACPTGYNYNTDDGKTSVSQCQIHCNAGYYLARAGNSSCSEVGDGYYSSAETLNYGSISVRTRCSNPEERTGTLTATSADQCSLLCTDATYFDSNTNRCVACPTGYTAHIISGKTSASQCQISCPAGTYLAVAGDTSCIPVGIGYWAAASTVNYGSTSSRTACPNGQITSSNNSGSASACLAVCTGATYRNANNECVACPSGYVDNTDTGKTSINQCQHRCNAGTYMTKYTPVEYIQGDGSKTFVDTNYSITSNQVKIKLVVGTRNTTTGDVGNFFGNLYELGGISANYKSNVFGLWMRHSNNNGAKAPSATMTFTADSKYTIEYNVTTNGTATGTISVNGANPPGKKQVASSRFNGEDNTFKLFSNGGAYIDENGNVVSNRWGDKLFNGNIYSLKLWDGGTTDAYLKLDLIPVRRYDGVLGFYNRVNSEFYPNSGKGNFGSATCTVDIEDASDVCDQISACSPVGYGYYIGENYTNYGSDGVRNQCPNGAGTIENNAPINNAGSIYKCEGIEPCTGATYPNYTTGICTPCPTGYDADTSDNKESISQCKIHCNDGYYLLEEYDSSCTAADVGYYVAASDIKYGEINEPFICTNAPGHSVYSGNAATNNCPWVCDAKYYADGGTCTDPGVGYYSGDGENARHACTNEIPTHSSYSGSASTDNCPWSCDTEYKESNGQCVNTICVGATYLDDGECVACPTGYIANTASGKTSVNECQLVCPGGTYMATANRETCNDVGAGYWAAESVVNYGSTSSKNACSSGLTTVGYGHGADESGDCGRILHVGNYVIYAKSTKPTIPAINIQPENSSVYYVGVSNTDHTLTPLHVTQGDLQYTAFDDSILYGERDFHTNTRIE